MNRAFVPDHLSGKSAKPRKTKTENIPHKNIPGRWMEGLESRVLFSGIGADLDSISSAAVAPITQNAAPTLPAPVVHGPGSSTAPGPVITTLTPTFTWNGVGGVSGYQLNLYNQTLAAGYSYKIGATATSFTLPTDVLRGGDKYVWNLRVIENGVSGPPSTYLYFQTAAATTLPTPIVLSPGSTQAPGPVLTTLTPTFKWDAVTGVDGYQLNLYDITAAKFFSYKITGATTTSFLLPAGVLLYGDKYVWNLRVLKGTASGPPSVYLYFQAPVLPHPIVLSPGSTVAPGPVLTTLTPTFTWESVPGITGYQLNLYDLATAKFFSYKISPTATSFVLPAGVLEYGNKYVWNLRVLEGTVSGPPSAYLYFQTPSIPKPIVTGPGSTVPPGPVLTTATPTFKWDAITGVTGYILSIFDLSTDELHTYTIGASLTSYTLSTALPAGDMFVWNLRAAVGTATGPTSQSLFFQT